MGPSVKFVLAIIDSISKKKWGLIFFLAKLDTKGGGPRASCLWMQKIPIFIFEYFPYHEQKLDHQLFGYLGNLKWI